MQNLPFEEKELRKIEREQTILKQFTYTYLKKEESEINFAVTESSIKVVEYAITNNKPTYPNSTTIYTFAFILGFILPILIFYILKELDNTITGIIDIKKLSPNLNVLCEIPEIKEGMELVTSENDRSVLAESFRVLSSNINFFTLTQKSSTKSIIIYLPQLKEKVKLCAINYSINKSFSNNKILLIGCDLRNPQLHKYLDIDKNRNGLSNYLASSMNWKENIHKHNQNLDVLVSGVIPPNPYQLLESKNFNKLIQDAKKSYDLIIIDTSLSSCF